MIVLDDLSTGRLRNLDSVADRITLVVGDIADSDRVRTLARKADYVIHGAALSSFPFSIAHPIKPHEVNVTSTLNLLNAALDAGVKRFVYASSAAVYGKAPDLPLRETGPLQPLSPHAASKLAAESYCRSYFTYYGLPTVVLRYFNVYGPRQGPRSHYSGVIPRFVTRRLQGEALQINGDGQQSRGLVYVQDVVQATRLACEQTAAVGTVLNVASEMAHTLLEAFQDLAEVMGLSLSPAFGAPPSEVKPMVASIEQMGRVLGYVPAVSWREGLEKTVKWSRRALATA